VALRRMNSIRHASIFSGVSVRSRTASPCFMGSVNGLPVAASHNRAVHQAV
jgi:hypothetical protein